MTDGSSSSNPDATSAQSFLIAASEQLAATRSMAELVDVLHDTARGVIGALPPGGSYRGAGRDPASSGLCAHRHHHRSA